MDRRYVGIDLHRRRSVTYGMDAAGERLLRERIANEPLRLLEVVSAAGVGAEVVIEAREGWYWGCGNGCIPAAARFGACRFTHLPRHVRPARVLRVRARAGSSGDVPAL
jgi:hypothetical protein